MKRTSLIISLIFSLCFIQVSAVIAFENQLTHPKITEKAVNNSILAGDYLQNQLGLANGLNTELELLLQFQSDINTRVAQEPDSDWNKTKISISDWLIDGSMLEDVPAPRARHHFHAPINYAGLDNSDGPSWAVWLLETGSLRRYPTYWPFDATGASSLDRARHNAGHWEDEYFNYYYWLYARDLFYYALTEQYKTEREKNLGSMFVTLGHICHLIEDMGVPAHTRNDFIFAHMWGGLPKYERITGENRSILDGGNPFEIWVERNIRENNQKIPTSWLSGVGSGIPAFSKLVEHWDTDAYVGLYVGATTPSSWGLSERTNYQFLSHNTIFDGAKYVFPNPAKGNTTLTPETIGNEKFYYRAGYEVPHLTRSTFSAYIADKVGIPLPWETDTTEEENVFEDYVERTCPRTIDYTTGLINYFFRGLLTAVPSCMNSDCSQMELYITNDSSNSGVAQSLKGGTFELYWDDNSDNRSIVPVFTVFDSDDPGNTNPWNSNTTLSYGNSVRAEFDRPSAHENISNFILVYRGSISSNPADPDPDDPSPKAIAVDMFKPSPYITNITPDMGHPGSVLLIEGSAFSPTPADNIVLFEDIGDIRPDVYGTVLDADSAGTWITVELPTFDAAEVDYYWTYTTVTVDGKVSNDYDFRLTNYIWCTIKLWDCGTSIDDEFDLYINEEYIVTSYMDPPGDPTIVEIGFWYEDEYDFVDTYLYESYDIPGGTLGISIEPYVDRVIAYRWNSTLEVQEFIYDNQYSGTFSDCFGSSLLAVPDDGIQLDVYMSLTYTGTPGAAAAGQAQTSTPITLESSVAGESKFGLEASAESSVDMAPGTSETLKVDKKIRTRMRSASRTRNRVRRPDGQ